MADIAITPASVLAGGGSNIDYSGVAGVVLTAGQVVYKEAATGLIKLAEADSVTAEAKVPYGISLNGGAVGQPIVVLTSGPITIGGTLVAGTAYYLSDTSVGGIRTTPDTGDLVVLLGLAASATVLNVRIQNSGVTL